MKNLTSNEIKPTGWLKKQLEIQANGLSGNLHNIWPDIKDSAWIGGTKEGWERVPYWLDGFIPLAYLLENEELIETAKKYIDAIISFQREDGWICPCTDDESKEYDTWAVLLISKVLTVYADCSGEEERIIDVLSKTLKNFSEHINYISLTNWGRARWYEGLIAIKWLYDRTGEEWLKVLVQKLKIQGIDWNGIIENNILGEYGDKWNYYSHTVNVAMMLKAYALMGDFEEADGDAFAEKAFGYLTEHNGNAYGHFNGDECLAPSSPIRGAELCSVVEAMYSYEVLFAKTENPVWLDRLETLAFNGLPATISPDMWTHQYDQQVNQVQCAPMKESVFGSNNEEAHMFGLEPHFGCCTSNFSQGWPKFALNTFLYDENGIMAAAVAPATVNIVFDGVNVECKTVTEYPFRNTVIYEIHAQSPVEFIFSFRIPACVKRAKYQDKEVKGGEVISIKKVWNDETIQVEYELEAKLVKRPNNMNCLWYGPLLYSVPIEAKWEKVEYEKDGVERKYPYCDYHIYPQSKWNYGFAGSEFEVKLKSYDVPFSDSNPPVSLVGKMRQVKWDFDENGHCKEFPDITEISEKIEELELLPYGCTTLRITEMPILR